MTLHHVTSHVTSVICLFIVKKEKEIQKKRIKSRKIDKRKRKMFSPHTHHNIWACSIEVYLQEKKNV